MITHKGYIFITPDGHFLTRSPYTGHGGKDWRMDLTLNMDNAELFPSPRIPDKPNHDWERVVNGMGLWKGANLEEHLIPLHAVTRQEILLIKPAEVQTNDVEI